MPVPTPPTQIVYDQQKVGLSKWRQRAISTGLILDPSHHFQAAASRGRYPTQVCGVSIEFLEHFASSLDYLDVKSYKETTQLVQKLIVPTTSLKGTASTSTSGAKTSTSGASKQNEAIQQSSKMFKHCRFWDILPSDYTGPPQYYVVHTWTADLQSTLQQVVDR